jgi:hypothetical protein
MPSLAHYTAQYDHEHKSAANKLAARCGDPHDFLPGSFLFFS